MASYKIRFHVTDGTDLTAIFENKPENIDEVANELVEQRYNFVKNPDGSGTLIDMENVCFVYLEKWEG